MNAQSNAPSICSEQSTRAMHVRTDGRTNGEAWSPHAEISPSVTRTRTYGISSSHLLDQAIDALAHALGSKGRVVPGPTNVERDRKWKRHRAELVAACQGRDLCAYRKCLRPTGEPDESWCHRHSADPIAIERAMTGERLPLMPHERREAIRLMTSRGASNSEIGEALGVSGSTISAAREEAA